MGVDVLFVVRPFGQPNVRDRQGQGDVGAGAGSEPFVGDQPGGVVVEGIDSDHFHPEILEPLPPGRALERGVDAAAGGLGVGRPEHDHLAVLERVLQQVVLLGQAQAVALAPHVRGAPVPALPAIGVVLAVGEAHQVHEAEVGAVPVADVAPHVVRTRRAEDGAGTVLALDPLDLGGHDVERFVPGDGLVAGDTAVLWIAAAGAGGAGSAGGVEVDALERGEDALGRVDQRPVADGVGRAGGLARRGEGPAPRLDGPRSGVGVVELDGGHADDPAVLHIHKQRASVGAGRESLDLSWCHRHPRGPPSVSKLPGAARGAPPRAAK